MRLCQLVAKGLHPVHKKNFFRLRITFYNEPEITYYNRFANFMILTSPSTERRSWGNNIIPSTFFGHTLSCCPRKIGLSYPHIRNLFHPYSGILNLLLLWYDIIIAPPFWLGTKYQEMTKLARGQWPRTVNDTVNRKGDDDSDCDGDYDHNPSCLEERRKFFLETWLIGFCCEHVYGYGTGTGNGNVPKERQVLLH